MPIISLTTDFGLKDGFVGVLKGVIWSICPEAQIADVSHAVAAQNVLEAALILGRAYAYFPPGTVHLAVVDPGVGTARRPLAARLGAQFFVGPDNGLFTPMLMKAEKEGRPVEMVHLTNPRYFLPQVSHTFHGRDIFAPIAAHLATGIALDLFGPALTDPVRLSMPQPEKTPSGWRAHVTAVDVFGNLATDLPEAALIDQPDLLFRLRGHEVRGLVSSYGQQPSGELVALVDSENQLELAVVNGSAAQVTGARVGDIVEIVVE